jgi:hypothetical protein
MLVLWYLNPVFILTAAPPYSKKKAIRFCASGTPMMLLI